LATPQRPDIERISPRVSTSATRALLLLLALALAACRGPADTPEVALREFVQLIRARRAAPAWALVSAKSQAQLEALAKAQAEATGAQPTEEPAALLFELIELAALRKIESVSVVSPIGHEVTLRVWVEGGQTANVEMVREGGRWKVDLIESLVKTSTAG